MYRMRDLGFVDDLGFTWHLDISVRVDWRIRRTDRWGWPEELTYLLAIPVCSAAGEASADWRIRRTDGWGWCTVGCAEARVYSCGREVEGGWIWTRRARNEMDLGKFCSPCGCAMEQIGGRVLSKRKVEWNDWFCLWYNQNFSSILFIFSAISVTIIFLVSIR
jgi:hypothetical protein